MELVSVGAKLVSAELITPDQYREILNPYKPYGVCAAYLIDLVQVKVQQHPQWYAVFITVIKENKYVLYDKSIVSYMYLSQGSIGDLKFVGRSHCRQCSCRGWVCTRIDDSYMCVPVLVHSCMAWFNYVPRMGKCSVTNGNTAYDCM